MNDDTNFLESVSIRDIYEMATGLSADSSGRFARSARRSLQVRCPSIYRASRHKHDDIHPSAVLFPERGTYHCICGGRGGKLQLIVDAIGTATLERALQQELHERRVAAELAGGSFSPPMFRKPDLAGAMVWLRKQLREPRREILVPIKPISQARTTLLDARLTGTYTYHKLDGSIAYEILRYDGTPAEPGMRDKDFEWWRLHKPWPQGTTLREIDLAKERSKAEWRRVDDRGIWIKNSKGCELIPYKLPELSQAAADQRIVMFPEGEGKADFLRDCGFAATSTPKGTIFFIPDNWTEYFKGVAGVVVLADSDTPGRTAAQRRSRFLSKIAPWTTIIDFFPQSAESGQDIMDWREAQDTQDPAELGQRLRALVRDHLRTAARGRTA